MSPLLENNAYHIAQLRRFRQKVDHIWIFEVPGWVAHHVETIETRTLSLAM